MNKKSKLQVTMRRGLASICSTLLFLACMGHPDHDRRPVNAGTRNPTSRVMLLHADTGFKDPEREMIKEATDAIDQQTAGLLKVSITYDLDFEDMRSIVRLGNDDLLVRAPPAAPYVTFEDREDGRLLGVVGGVDLANYDPTVVKRIYLVADRLWTHDVFVHVAAHEMYHAFGMRHVSDPQAIMFFQVKGPKPSLCIGKSDAEELCRVSGCQLSDLNYCD